MGSTEKLSYSYSSYSFWISDKLGTYSLDISQEFCIKLEHNLYKQPRTNNVEAFSFNLPWLTSVWPWDLRAIFWHFPSPPVVLSPLLDASHYCSLTFRLSYLVWLQLYPWFRVCFLFLWLWQTDMEVTSVWQLSTLLIVQCQGFKLKSQQLSTHGFPMKSFATQYISFNSTLCDRNRVLFAIFTKM